MVGSLAGKFFFHKLMFNRWMKLSMFKRDSGSWMVMFLSTLVSLFIFSFLYNGFLSIEGDKLSLYKITSYLGLQNDTFMKAAGLGTWMGDFITAWMVTDMMLQVKAVLSNFGLVNIQVACKVERHRGIMVSVVESWLRGLGSRPGQLILLRSWAKHLILTLATLHQGV